MKQLDKKAVWLFFLNSLLATVAGAAVAVGWSLAWWSRGVVDAGGYFNISGFVGRFILVLIVLGVISFIWAKLTYHFYRYEFTELGFRKESGVIWKKYVTIPYTRIQNVDINRGILARILGLSDLEIQTAGTSATMSRYGVFGVGAEAGLLGVSKEDAEILRDELVKRASKSASQGL